ncbi:MAG: phage protein Gp36 family protein [Leeuwenhoekiella sp.]
MAIAFQFISREDLETRVFEDYIDESEQEDIEATQIIEKQAIAYVKSKLRKRYDIDTIFSPAVYEGRDLITWAISGIVAYRLIRRNAARKVPSDFVKDYDEVKEWLNAVRDGNDNPDLPVLEEVQEKQVLWGNSKNEDLYL